MSIGELLVELVLAGLITLAALFFPAYSMGLLGFGLSTDVLAVAIALGFAIGVIIDRSTDTILERWLGLVRLKFAEKVTAERNALVGSGLVQDVFPEDWLRIQILVDGSEAAVRAMEALRTRIRVARNMVVLMPVLTVSAIIGGWPPDTHKQMANAEAAVLFPLFELVALISAVVIARWWLKAPRTSAPAATVPSRASWLASAVSAWFGLHLLAAAAAIVFSADQTTAVGATAAGFLLTALAALAWERMTVSFMALLWNHSRFTDPKKLAEHMSSGSRSTQVLSADMSTD